MFIICLVDEDDVIEHSSRLKIYSTGCFVTRSENKSVDIKGLTLSLWNSSTTIETRFVLLLLLLLLLLRDKIMHPEQDQIWQFWWSSGGVRWVLVVKSQNLKNAKSQNLKKRKSQKSQKCKI